MYRSLDILDLYVQPDRNDKLVQATVRCALRVTFMSVFGDILDGLRFKCGILVH